MFAFSVIRAFFSSTLGKDILGLLAIAALVFGVFEVGVSHGESKGFTQGVESQKTTIDKLTTQVATLTKQINDDRQATADKTHTIEKQASDATIAIEKDQAARDVVRTQIVNKYRTSERLVPSQCGLSKPSIDTINEIINTQKTWDTSDVPAPTSDNDKEKQDAKPSDATSNLSSPTSSSLRFPTDTARPSAATEDNDDQYTGRPADRLSEATFDSSGFA